MQIKTPLFTDLEPEVMALQKMEIWNELSTSNFSFSEFAEY